MKSFIIVFALTLVVSSIKTKMAPLKVVVKDDASVNAAAQGWLAAMSTLDATQRAFHNAQSKMFENIQATTRSQQAAFETGKNAAAKWQAVGKIFQANKAVITQIRTQLKKLRAARTAPRKALQAAWKNLMAKGKAAFTAARATRKQAYKNAKAAKRAARNTKNVRRRLAHKADKWCSSHGANKNSNAFCENFEQWVRRNSAWTILQLASLRVELKELNEMKNCAAAMRTNIAGG
jgi:hypothetical protein